MGIKPRSPIEVDKHTRTRNSYYKLSRHHLSFLSLLRTFDLSGHVSLYPHPRLCFDASKSESDKSSHVNTLTAIMGGDEEKIPTE